MDNRGLFWCDGTMFHKVYNLSPVPRIGEKVSIKTKSYLVKDINYLYIDTESTSEVDGQIDIDIYLENLRPK